MPLLLALAGCGGQPQRPPQGPPTVGVVTVQPTEAAMTTELPGRTDAFLISEVRPQVSGIIRKRLFTEGSLVHQGQPLYQIDPSLYQAAVGQAKGQLAGAQANAVSARLKAERYTELEKINAVAKQDAADARAAAGQANAAVEQSRAALQSAEINLRYTTVRAPISGRIGRSSVTPGALVTADQAAALATISALDPIYVDIQQSASQLLQLRQSIAKGGALPNEAAVRLKLDDGTDYPYTGKLEFAEVNVDPSTGAVTLRARFPNPQGLLLPGLYVRAVVSQAVRKGVFLVPALAVKHDPKGNASVLVVDAQGKVSERPVETQGLQDGNWVVTGGLNAGDRVVVNGLDKARPGATVHPVAATGKPGESAVIDQPPAAGGDKGKAGGAPGAAR
ncbi:MAG TPA: efflux RND transporter periplasmic adaptor subunit [Sphingomonas sp.]|nr:efflux RND transporter periplasmic adaptor subunit [Sphingomonas sp.]